MFKQVAFTDQIFSLNNSFFFKKKQKTSTEIERILNRYIHHLCLTAAESYIFESFSFVYLKKPNGTVTSNDY